MPKSRHEVKSRKVAKQAVGQKCLPLSESKAAKPSKSEAGGQAKAYAPQTVGRETLIGELIFTYPEAVEVLYKYGFHCIGCGLSAYETLEQGASAHGFDDATLDLLIEEIKAAHSEAQSREKEKGMEANAGKAKTKEKKQE